MNSNEKYSTREEWLTAAILAVAPIFADHEITLPPVRVSVGWPGGRGKKANDLGQCWHGSAAADGVSQMFISPVIGAEPVQVLATLVHELVHAVNFTTDVSGHGAAFRRVAVAVGLTGKMTATVAGEDLAAKLTQVAVDLGDYPHAVITTAGSLSSGPKKQGTRMVKCVCLECGYVARTTRKWLDEVGPPICPCVTAAMSVES